MRTKRQRLTAMCVWGGGGGGLTGCQSFKQRRALPERLHIQAGPWRGCPVAVPPALQSLVLKISPRARSLSRRPAGLHIWYSVAQLWKQGREGGLALGPRPLALGCLSLLPPFFCVLVNCTWPTQILHPASVAELLLFLPWACSLSSKVIFFCFFPTIP